MNKSRFRKTILIVALIAVAAAAAAAWRYLSGQDAPDRLVLSGTIEADEIHVGSKVGGRIAAVLVKEGQMVKQGEALVRFESYDLDARRADALAAVAQAEANLEKTEKWFRPEEVAEARASAEAAWMAYELARNGPRDQEVDAARAEMAAASADLDVARATLARVEQLVKTGVQSRQDYDNAKSAFDRAAARQEAARQRLDLLLAGTRSEEIARAERQYKQAAARRELVERGARREDIETAKAQLERARAGLQQIDTQMTELEIRAPSDCYVEVLQVRPGDLITPNASVATLVELSRLWVRVYVPEPELGHIQLGKEVSVTVDTFGDTAFSGSVEQIAAQGEFTPRNVQTREERTHQVFGVRVRLKDGDRKLRAGMAADVTIMR
ncbi:MAG TPA: efflux RND transporter periplasmic adaptor subunit [Blastocatellia bacterium]|jgi:multidrug resistance efflux pump